ncbi:MAG: hypothetical protein HC860_21715 [Alkalinema sp. RU_4_3]|jgi:hypothetical protein|nr:hypothetical protein [Alkalinema sp. RU_4_3]
MMMTPKSGLLLGLACIFGVAAVGSVFEITSGQPDWGFTATWTALGVSIPGMAVAFVLAVKDARANL